MSGSLYCNLWPDAISGNDCYVLLVYSCGGLVPDSTLLLPLAFAISFTRLAGVPVERLLAAMT